VEDVVPEVVGEAQEGPHFFGGGGGPGFSNCLGLIQTRQDPFSGKGMTEVGHLVGRDVALLQVKLQVVGPETVECFPHM
jgi:hypothetical protein